MYLFPKSDYTVSNFFLPSKFQEIEGWYFDLEGEFISVLQVHVCVTYILVSGKEYKSELHYWWLDRQHLTKQWWLFIFTTSRYLLICTCDIHIGARNTGTFHSPIPCTVYLHANVSGYNWPSVNDMFCLIKELMIITKIISFCTIIWVTDFAHLGWDFFHYHLFVVCL